MGNVVGRITHITDGAGTEDRLYGPLGEIVQETRAIPIQRPSLDLHHAVQVVTYNYDSGGLVSRVKGSDDQLETNYASAIAYDKFGQRLSMTNGNGVVTTYAYKPDNRRLLNVQATLPVGYTFDNFNFTYDNVGNLLTLQNNVQPPRWG